LPLALGGAAACASTDGASPRGNEQTGSVSSSIIGGHLDTTTKGVVALGLAAHDLVEVTCSGSLIAPNLVLTARHCVSQIGDGSSAQVTCGVSRFTGEFDPRFLFVSTDPQPSTSSKLYAIEDIRTAPGSSDVCGFDLALVILSGAGIPASEAAPLDPVLDHAPGAKQSFAAVGYGKQDPDDDASAGTRMRFDSSSVLCVGSKCPSSYEAEDDEWVGKSPVCSGDSGGPALDTNGHVFGVTSRGDKDCTFAIYSNVSNWASFVRTTAIAAAKSGKYTAPSWATDSTAMPGSSSAGAGPTAAAGAGSSGAANSSAGSGGAGGTMVPPTDPVDPLGSSCAGDCPADYKCFTASGTPPGICVPQCNPAGLDTCPERYSCSEELKVCTPKQATVKTAHVAASCAVSRGQQPASGSLAFPALLGLGVLWFGRRRRNAA